MSTLSDRPTALSRVTPNRNFFLPIQSDMVIRRLADVEYFCQAVSLPGVSMTPVEQHNPLTPIRHAGDVVRFDEFRAEFIVDEFMENYFSIYDWIIRLGFPESSDQYRSLSSVPQHTGEGLMSDVSLIMRDSKGRPKIEFTLIDAFPIAITPVEVDSRKTDTEFLTATATFVYTRYEMRRGSM